MSKPKILRCRICGRSQYVPIAVPVQDKGMPCGLDFVFSSRFLCLGCRNEVDIHDPESVARFIDPDH